MMQATQPILAPGGVPLSLRDAGAGRSHTDGEDGRRRWPVGDVRREHGGEPCRRWAQVHRAHVRAMSDVLIARTDLTSRLHRTSDDDESLRSVALNPPKKVKLSTLAAVVWCTGFVSNFSWLDTAMLDLSGRPRHNGCEGSSPGLWYVGLRWLTHRSSATLPGIPKDAAAVAAAVEAPLAHHLERT